MLTKIVILLSVTAILAFRLKTTPEELQAYLKQIEEIITGTEHDAKTRLRSFLIPLGEYTNVQNKYIIGNVTEAAKPYWDEIASLQEQAAENGQNISSCVDLGNKQLYALNQTTISPLILQVNSYYVEGYDLLMNNSDVVTDVFPSLFELEARASNCSDDDCAYDLKTEAMVLFQLTMDTIVSAVDVVGTYVLEDLPANLAQIKVDKDSYVKRYGLYLEDVKNCINKQ